MSIISSRGFGKVSSSICPHMQSEHRCLLAVGCFRQRGDNGGVGGDGDGDGGGVKVVVAHLFQEQCPRLHRAAVFRNSLQIRESPATALVWFWSHKLTRPRFQVLRRETCLKKLVTSQVCALLACWPTAELLASPQTVCMT